MKSAPPVFPTYFFRGKTEKATKSDEEVATNHTIHKIPANMAEMLIFFIPIDFLLCFIIS